MWRTITVAAILMLLTGVQAQHSVTLSSQSLYAVTGSTVKIPCTFRPPDHSSVTQREWYRVQSSEEKPQDLSTDPQYSGRVSVSTVTSDCELTVRNVRVSDSGVYNFRFKTRRSDWISASSGVHLTVTDLKVTVSDSSNGYKKLSCITTCTLSNNPTYIWYNHGQRVTNHNRNDLDVSSWYAGSYSCAVRGHEDLRSPAVCVYDEQKCWSVTYSTQTICSLIDSSVDIHSYYTFPEHYKVTKVLWFIKEQADGEPVDVREDEEYQGRVQYTQSSQNNCSLRITNLTERDAQTYRFRFYTDGGDYTGEPGVSLSVTAFKVTGPKLSDGYKKLSCKTTCTLSNNPTYIWYKNGQRVTDQNRNDLDVSSGNAGSYSCAVGGHEDLRSPAVCVYDEKSCWSVTYSTQNICSVIGSSVDIHSYYTFPHWHKVTKVLWFIKVQADGEPVDVREDEEYQSRVQYTQSSQNNCSLRITNLTERDTQTYRFKFYTDDPKGRYTGNPEVSLSVTDLKITVSDWRDQYMTLSCITTCTLSNNPTYIWYKNGQRVSDCKSASCSVAAVSGAVSYSCAVEGHDSLLSPPVYSPKNTRAVVLSSGDTVEGDSVILSCSSDANPPVLTYSWFKQKAAADTLLTTGQNYSISNISSQHSGLYYCTAHNQLGQHNSTPTLLDVLFSEGSEENTVLKLIMVGLGVFLALTLIPGALWMWKRKLSSANSHSSTGESEQPSPDAVYETVPALDFSRRVASDDQDNLQYASVVLKTFHTQGGSLSPRLPPDTTEEKEVQYAAVNISRSTAATQLGTDEMADDLSQIYSKVHKIPRK
ncbi:B-cell receptor CD22-like [Clarias gariepinus]|uniref:B-cell receptor CD22-like n=1 Tax=Clarias gariepinus TaxID=13013 RepID=UPI00234E0549|nr:B-cell receptor CD22-like [Clarias gariepinus]